MVINLNSYQQQLSELRGRARRNQIPDEKINEILEKCFQELKQKNEKKLYYFFLITRFILGIIIFIILCSICLYNYSAARNIVLRNIQNLIYPGLTILRQLAVPVITKYPSITDFYDESCLVENPFFRANIDCWPCSTVQSVPNVTGWNVSKIFNIGVPLIKTEEPNRDINLSIIANTYENHSDIFDIDARKVSSNNIFYKTIRDVVQRRLDKNPSTSMDTHIVWKVNRMKPSRLLRKLIPNPSGIPEWWSQSTERFLLIDEPKTAGYTLPNPECTNVILRSTNGLRLIKMIPSFECKQSCKSFVVLLSRHDTLWYNWWYWRPISFPVANSTEISINYLTSFC